MEDESIKVPICILVDPKEIKLVAHEIGPTYKGSFYTYKTDINLEGDGQHHEIIKADKNGLLTNSFYDRGSTKNVDRTYYRLIRESYDYREFAGFLQLFQIVSMRDIRMKIFRFIGALLFKESSWRYLYFDTYSYAKWDFVEWCRILQEIKKKKMEEIYLTYFKD